MSRCRRLTWFIAVLFAGFVTVSGVSAQSPAAYGGVKAKYVFLFIGDGLGMPQRAAATEFLKDSGMERRLAMEAMPVHGVTATRAADRFITGSAAAGTAMATGVKTNIGCIGVDASLRPVATLAERAKREGFKVGILSSVSIDHATPAAFYAHEPSRSMYHEIDHALAASDIDFFGGGGLKDPEGKKSEAPRGDALAAAKANGFTVADSRRKIMDLGKGDGRVIAINPRLPDGKAMPYDMDRNRKDVSLAELTQKAVELLDGDPGFFIMVEGGKIDWACHANDAAAAIKDTLAFDDAVTVAVDFAATHPDETLIVVTGDHECGGLALGFSGTKYATSYSLMNHQTKSHQAFFDDVFAGYLKKKGSFDGAMKLVKAHFGLAPDADGPLALKPFEVAELKRAFDASLKGETLKPGMADYMLYGSYDPFTMQLTHLLNRKAGLGWTTYSHTGVPVLTSASGAGASLFSGCYDNTDIAKKIAHVMNL
ncbi:alkaline phosphatase [Desulfoluna spongiiphila]|uniref:alkaline phosphatase n=1 Tax=Desulfoluna spongiiphila TaxID=419481 RepID=UPI001257277E|nr:alkaline phosphatase [Desulfoluna spongiiphila]VVS92548.1 alkaline phosphatase [Desulfoluna spongiiphila]